MLPLKFNKSTNAMIARKISDRKNLRPFLLRLKESGKKSTARYCPGIFTLAFCVFRAFAVAAAGARPYFEFFFFLQLVSKVEHYKSTLPFLPPLGEDYISSILE